MDADAFFLLDEEDSNGRDADALLDEMPFYRSLRCVFVCVVRLKPDLSET